MLPQQVEQRRLHGGDGVDGGAQVKRLQPAPAAVAVGELPVHGLQHAQVVADRLAHDQRAGVLERLADLLAARHLAHAGATGAVGQDQEVAGEERPVRAAQVEQHGVAPGDRDDPQRGDDGRA